MTVLRTDRLLLRPLSERAVEAMVAYRSRVDVCRYVPLIPMRDADVVERIAGQWARTELTDEGQALTLGVELVDRLGMRLEARLVENELFKGEWSNELDFAILAPEWAARAA